MPQQNLSLPLFILAQSADSGLSEFFLQGLELKALTWLAGALLIGVLAGLLSVVGYSIITPAIEDSIGLQVVPHQLTIK